MQSSGSEAAGGRGLREGRFGKAEGEEGEDFKPDFKARRGAAIYHRCAHITYETTSDVVGLVEREEFLATTSRCNGRWNRRQLEMTQEACDHRLLGDGGNDPQ
jgi:hypothetical protein